MNLLEKLAGLCKSNNSDINEIYNENAQLIAIYAFYHYLSGDESQIDDLKDNICYKEPFSFWIDGIFKSTTMDGNAIDFLSTVSKEELKTFSDSDLDNILDDLSRKIGAVAYHTGTAKIVPLQVYDTLGIQALGTDDTFFTIRLLCNWEPSPSEKISYQKKISNKQYKDGKVAFEILFADDIDQEIDDIEAPNESVPIGTIETFGKETKCILGDEGSFITIVSALSLKQLFFSYSTRGLFASNLRFFISSKKIDPKITSSIQNEPDNFAYYNNGIIITCSDYTEKDNSIVLRDFSIVNGGQTTNLIGRTDFDKDFGVVCKIIKNKYSSSEEKAEFLSKVAEASNTQKPINAKDLIANRKEQRLLKEQFSSAGMFLKVKRGEKINKKRYPETWQNASNDEIAQMLYSYIYQCPGAAKNSKAVLLSNERIYNMLFSGSSYSSQFFVSIQFLKTFYSSWKKFTLKTEPKNTIVYGLSKHADLLTDATIGLLMKMATNKVLTQKLLSMLGNKTTNQYFSENDVLKFLIRQNDIGSISLLKTNLAQMFVPKLIFPFFDFIFRTILSPAYSSFRNDFPDYAYSQFCKTDTYYYNYVIPSIIRTCFQSYDLVNENMEPFFNIVADTSEGFKPEELFADYKPGLEEELLEYRRKTCDEDPRIKQGQIFLNRQLPFLIQYLPKTNEKLIYECGFKEEQAQRFGPSIIRIINKYCDMTGFQ